MKKIVALLLIELAFMSTARANIAPCGHLNVQITNFTSSICTLTSQKMDRGVFVTLPPMSILPSETKHFQLVQSSYWGPSATISYTCGDESITINSNQDFNFGMDYFSSSNLAGSVLPPIPHSFNAAFTAIPGTCSSAPGNISWVFKPRESELKVTLEK